ncbi:MAG: hypothetical protein H0X51_04705 [Parachlamydiaceae bacterium]|nr:hypothetical protein [Parachlamydiaceae bacterium]
MVSNNSGPFKFNPSAQVFSLPEALATQMESKELKAQASTAGYSRPLHEDEHERFQGFLNTSVSPMRPHGPLDTVKEKLVTFIRAGNKLEDVWEFLQKHPLHFTAREVIEYLRERLPKIIHSKTPFACELYGGGTKFTLASMRFSDADVGFTLNCENASDEEVRSLFGEIKLLTLALVKERLRFLEAPLNFDNVRLYELLLDLYHSPNSTASKIIELAQGKKRMLASLSIPLGGVQLTFVVQGREKPRSNVSCADSFFISYPECIIRSYNAGKAADKEEFGSHLSTLRNRTFVVTEPSKVKHLGFRVLLAWRDGMLVSSETQVIASKQFIKLIVNPKEVEFKNKYLTFLNNHYPEDETGKAFNFFNLLAFIKGLKSEQMFPICTLEVLEVWTKRYAEHSDSKLLKIVQLLTKQPQLILPFISFLQGILLYQFMKGHPNFRAYVFDFMENAREARNLLSYTPGEKTHYLNIPHNQSPDQLLLGCIDGFQALEKFCSFSDMLLMLREIGVDAFVPFQRKQFVQQLVRAFYKMPMGSVLQQCFAQLRYTPFAQAVRKMVPDLFEEREWNELTIIAGLKDAQKELDRFSYRAEVRIIAFMQQCVHVHVNEERFERLLTMLKNNSELIKKNPQLQRLLVSGYLHLLDVSNRMLSFSSEEKMFLCKHIMEVQKLPFLNASDKELLAVAFKRNVQGLIIAGDVAPFVAHLLQQETASAVSWMRFTAASAFENYNKGVWPLSQQKQLYELVKRLFSIVKAKEPGIALNVYQKHALQLLAVIGRVSDDRGMQLLVQEAILRGMAVSFQAMSGTSETWKTQYKKFLAIFKTLPFVPAKQKEALEKLLNENTASRSLSSFLQFIAIGHSALHEKFAAQFVTYLDKCDLEAYQKVLKAIQNRQADSVEITDEMIQEIIAKFRQRKVAQAELRDETVRFAKLLTRTLESDRKEDLARTEQLLQCAQEFRVLPDTQLIKAALRIFQSDNRSIQARTKVVYLLSQPLSATDTRDLLQDAMGFLNEKVEQHKKSDIEIMHAMVKSKVYKHLSSAMLQNFAFMLLDKQQFSLIRDIWTELEPDLKGSDLQKMSVTMVATQDRHLVEVLSECLRNNVRKFPFISRYLLELYALQNDWEGVNEILTSRVLRQISDRFPAPINAQAYRLLFEFLVKSYHRAKENQKAFFLNTLVQEGDWARRELFTNQSPVLKYQFMFLLINGCLQIETVPAVLHAAKVLHEEMLVFLTSDKAKSRGAQSVLNVLSHVATWHKADLRQEDAEFVVRLMAQAFRERLISTSQHEEELFEYLNTMQQKRNAPIFHMLAFEGMKVFAQHTLTEQDAKERSAEMGSTCTHEGFIELFTTFFKEREFFAELFQLRSKMSPMPALDDAVSKCLPALTRELISQSQTQTPGHLVAACVTDTMPWYQALSHKEGRKMLAKVLQQMVKVQTSSIADCDRVYDMAFSAQLFEGYKARGERYLLEYEMCVAKQTSQTHIEALFNHVETMCNLINTTDPKEVDLLLEVAYSISEKVLLLALDRKDPKIFTFFLSKVLGRIFQLDFSPTSRPKVLDIVKRCIWFVNHIEVIASMVIEFINLGDLRNKKGSVMAPQKFREALKRNSPILHMMTMTLGGRKQVKPASFVQIVEKYLDDEQLYRFFTEFRSENREQLLLSLLQTCVTSPFFRSEESAEALTAVLTESDAVAKMMLQTLVKYGEDRFYRSFMYRFWNVLLRQEFSRANYLKVFEFLKINIISLIYCHNLLRQIGLVQKNVKESKVEEKKALTKKVAPPPLTFSIPLFQDSDLLTKPAADKVMDLFEDSTAAQIQFALSDNIESLTIALGEDLLNLAVHSRFFYRLARAVPAQTEQIAFLFDFLADIVLDVTNNKETSERFKESMMMAYTAWAEQEAENSNVLQLMEKLSKKHEDNS